MGHQLPIPSIYYEVQYYYIILLSRAEVFKWRGFQDDLEKAILNN